MSQEDSSILARKLDVIIALLLDMCAGDDGGQTSSKILKLRSLGLPLPDIATIVNKKTNYVSAVLSRAEKKGRGK